MKTKQILLVSLLATGSMSYAQWSGGCPETIMGCNVGIGTTAPTFKLHVVEPAGSGIATSALFDHTANAGGIYEAVRARITDNGSASDISAINAFASGAQNDVVGIKGQADGGTNAYGVYGVGNGGNGGVNCGGYFKLASSNGGNNVSVAVFGDANGFNGVGDFAGYFSGNVAVYGTQYIQGFTWVNQADLSVTGSGILGNIGASRDISSGRDLISGRDASVSRNLSVTDNAGVGLSAAPTLGRVEVETNSGGTGINTAGFFTSHANSASTYFGIQGRAMSTNGASFGQVGVYGESATAAGQCGQDNRGVYGIASGAKFNVGGIFIGDGYPNHELCCVQNIGVWGTTGLGCESIQSWAGWFNGDVGATGNFITTSDRKLKSNIKPMDNVLSKIMQLKPSTYNYKTDAELKDLHLPKGNQIGLIAQDLEQVFPELITNVTEINVKKNEKESIHTPEFKGVQYLPLITVLISGMQEQQKMIEEQKLLNENLIQRLAAIEQANGLNKGETGLHNNQNLLGNGFEMSQNEPNPFTRETLIKYSVPSQVNSAYLAVYDLSGKQISTFPITEKGNSSMVVTSENLAAGIYIYSIIADGKLIDSKRMVVVQK